MIFTLVVHNLIKLCIRNKKLNPTLLCYDDLYIVTTHFTLALIPYSYSIRTLAPLLLHMLQMFDNDVQF